ncbi:S8 family peptidase, partial [Candidatus Marithrix sp. Canyon 246]
NQFIIKLTEYGKSLNVPAIQKNLGLSTVETFLEIDAELWQFHELWQLNSNTRTNILRQLRGDPRVEYIEPNYIINIEQAPNQWGLKQIQAAKAWKQSSNQIIAVIDTGVDYTHPDLAANMWKNEAEIPDNGIDDDNNGCIDDIYGCDVADADGDPFDNHGHGTHVSGIIGSGKIMAIKFFQDKGYATLADAIAAIQYATKMGAKIANLSWGCMGCKSQALYDAIKKAKDVLFIAAAGNSQYDNDHYLPNYPSSYDLDNIISVAATDNDDKLAWFSNYGKKSVDLAAPGVNIYSSYPNKSHKSLSGTSMAAPYVTGAASLLLSKKCNIKQAILKNVDKIEQLSDKILTGGRLNVNNSLNSCTDTCKHAIYHSPYKNQKFGTIEVPKLALPLIDPITGRYIYIGIFSTNMKVELQAGTEDLKITLDNDKLKYIKEIHRNKFPQEKCYAFYNYENKTLNIPYVDIPHAAKLPNDQIINTGMIKVYNMTLIKSALDESIFYPEKMEYITRY